MRDSVALASGWCPECDRLYDESARVLMEYIAALDVLAATAPRDCAYVDRRVDLDYRLTRLDETQRLQRVHEDRHRRRH